MILRYAYLRVIVARLDVLRGLARCVLASRVTWPCGWPGVAHGVTLRMFACSLVHGLARDFTSRVALRCAWPYVTLDLTLRLNFRT